MGLSVTFAQENESGNSIVQDTAATRSVPKKGDVAVDETDKNASDKSVTTSDSTDTRSIKKDNVKDDSGVGSTGTVGAPGSGYGTGNSSGSSPAATSGNSKSGSGKTSGTGSGSTADGTSD